MGESSSKEENTENKGQVQNNIAIGEPVEVHNQKSTILLAIICVIKVLEVLIYFYKSFRRNLKKNLRPANGINMVAPDA